MPAVRHNPAAFPGIAAAALLPYQPVALATTVERGVLPCASTNQQPIGVTHATAASGRPVAVHEYPEIVEAIAGASLGGGVAVMVGSANGALVPAAAASGSPRFSVGQSLGPAAAGETFSLYVNPRQISGLS